MPGVDDDDLFSRDIDGHLLRMDKPTRDMLDEARSVTMTVDGLPVRIPKAVPATDAQGNILYDQRGNPIPRLTTLYDAISKRYGGAANNPVPVLCYQEHTSPVAVCRVCLVQVIKTDRGRAQDKLVPSCYQPVDRDLTVNTIASTELDDQGRPKLGDNDVPIRTKAALRIESAVGLLIEMLAADHLHRDAHPANELQKLAQDFGVASDQRFPRQARFAPPARPSPQAPPGQWAPEEPLDTSSPWFIVDRTACILCDRCIRGCGEVRGHFVLGRAKKGRFARIAFDWDSPMGQSNCVKCGECFISCPTDAITMRPGAKPSPWDFEPE